MNEQKFSILIPTWNNLSLLKLCVDSICRHSTYEHQILIYVNDGSDGTLDWVRQSGYQYLHSEQNVGVCYALNSLRTLVATNYIAFVNDDMYVLPQWDLHLWAEIEKIGHDRFFLSSTLLQPRPFFCKSVIAPADFGQSAEEFRQEDLLAHYKDFQHCDWYGATWPLNVVHRRMWDMVGGYSVEYTPGMYSDPDFSAKLYLAGVRYFKGLSNSRVYHFEARSTGRVRKNKGSRQFLMKWGITSSSFMRNVLRRGEPIVGQYSEQINVEGLRKSIIKSKIKRALSGFKSTGAVKNIFEQ